MADGERVDLVDENDRVIGRKLRRDLTTNDRYRMATVILINSQGQILIHKRAAQKSTYPNRWENAAGGAVKAGQTYEQAAYEELREEIGIDDVSLSFITTTRIITENGEKICGWFRGKCDKNIDDFTLEPKEVAEIKWVDREWLLADQDLNPDNYMPSAAQWHHVL